MIDVEYLENLQKMSSEEIKKEYDNIQTEQHKLLFDSEVLDNEEYNKILRKRDDLLYECYCRVIYNKGGVG